MCTLRMSVVCSLVMECSRKIIPTLQCSIGTWMGSVFSRTRGVYAPGGTLSTVYVALDNNGGELRKQCGREQTTL